MTTHARTTRPRTTRRIRRTARTAGLVVASLALTALAGCGAGEDHNDADVAFATEMIPHHAQAVEMAGMVDGKDVDPEVADLAAEIDGAQGPEIETMSGWLEEWGEPVPDLGADMSSMEMPGMMSADQMTSLEQAEGAEFQTAWLELMIEHHSGAIDMAAAEQDEGEDAAAVTLAEEIEAAQTEEIAVMEDLLAPS